jgi:type I restriction-modification system DNA methylase subunit
MKLSTQVLNILDSSALDGQALRLPGQLDRKVYLEVAQVIEAAGGKWNRKAGAHLFEVPAQDAIDQIIATGGVTTRQELQQFFTPPALANRMVEVADIQPKHYVLEPSAGRGALVGAACHIADKANICAIEIDESLWSMWAGAFGETRYADFLSIAPKPRFDRIIANPPFSQQSDIHHVRHMISFLKPGGRLVAIMSAGTLFRENRLAVDFRAEIAALDGRFEPLPEGSFRESGTMVNTCLLVVEAHQ